MIDLTCDRLEQGVKPLLALTAPTLISCEFPEIPDTYEGFIVNAKHSATTATSNDGKIPVLAVYEIEIILRVAEDKLAMARRKATGGVLKAFIAQELQGSINSILQDGEFLNIVNVQSTSEDLYIHQSRLYDFSTTLSVTCQPLIGTEE